MCGATGTQQQLQQEQIDAYQQAQTMTAEEYADQQAIYGPMTQQFQSIFSAGPNQEGFSGAEDANLNAQATEGTAENYQAAAKAVGENVAAEGGGNDALPTGGQTELKEQVANASAQQQSTEENQIQQADYQQGYDEWKTAGEGLQTIAAGENPLGFENAETSAGSAASNTANEIAEENNSWINAAIGAAGSIAGGFLGGGGGSKYTTSDPDAGGGALDYGADG